MITQKEIEDLTIHIQDMFTGPTEEAEFVEWCEENIEDIEYLEAFNDDDWENLIEEWKTSIQVEDACDQYEFEHRRITEDQISLAEDVYFNNLQGV